MSNREEICLVYPPRSIFQNTGVEEPDHLTTLDTQQAFHLNYFSFPSEGGIYTYYIGKKFPAQGWVMPEKVTRLNLYKRTLLASLLPFSNKNLLMCLWPMIFLSWRRKISILKGFIQAQNRLSLQILGIDYYKLERYGAPARELNRFVSRFLVGLGIEQYDANAFGLTIGHIIEFDSAYRNRLLDLMAETTKEKFKNSKEFKRLLGIFAERDARAHLLDRFSKVSGLLRVLFLSNKIKKAFNQAIEEMDLSKLQMTEADMYDLLTDGPKENGGYDWGGKKFEARYKIYESYHQAKVFEGPIPSKTVGWYPPYKLISNLR